MANRAVLWWQTLVRTPKQFLSTIFITTCDCNSKQSC
uniref:Uncharacterized protein n=1 Tax=Anguilla anguilla TaxID=7936 RepID=A0A0E9QW49_ANGAN